MKYIFLLAIVLVIPALMGYLKANPRNLERVSFLLGASMLVLGPSLWAAPIPWPTWPGPVRGLSVSFVDSFSIALILSTRPVRIPWWITSAFGIVCIALAISTLMAAQWEPSLFYVWQLARSVTLFVAIVRTCRASQRAAITLLAGLGAGLLFQAAFAAYQFHSGVQRPGGGFGPSNFLGLVSDFVTFPVLALALATRRTIWPLAVVLAGFAIALIGGSRATLGLFVIGNVLTLVFSFFRGFTARKTAFGVMALLGLLVSAPAVIWAINNRSSESKISSDTDRQAMKDAAWMIINEHPLGVGANQYVVVANTGGYSERAGVPWNADNRAAPVHDAYYLIAAELGLIGLMGFLAILASFIGLGFLKLKQRAGDASELLPGLLAALIIVSIHISYEWVFMDFMLHYLFAIGSGLLVGLCVSPHPAVGVRTVRSPAFTAAPSRG